MPSGESCGSHACTSCSTDCSSIFLFIPRYFHSRWTQSVETECGFIVKIMFGVRLDTIKPLHVVIIIAREKKNVFFDAQYLSSRLFSSLFHCCHHLYLTPPPLPHRHRRVPAQRRGPQQARYRRLPRRARRLQPGRAGRLRQPARLQRPDPGAGAAAVPLELQTARREPEDRQDDGVFCEEIL